MSSALSQLSVHDDVTGVASKPEQKRPHGVVLDTALAMQLVGKEAPNELIVQVRSREHHTQSPIHSIKPLQL
jgi:hypothetical protein